MAVRLDALFMKKNLSPAEKKEIEFILNGAMVIEEIINGKTPEEFRQ